MRMIGIGLMGFLLAGVALLLSTASIFEKGQRYVAELAGVPQLVFENRSAVENGDFNTATIYRSNPDHPVILSGLPAYQGVTFNMPLDARPTSGYLQIDATSQVLEGVEGVLRISIDNSRRGEMLLHSGEVGRSLRIPLSPTDFVRNQLVVSFSLQGEGAHARCSHDDGFDAIVEIETTSAIFLTLDRPLETPRDQINAWGQMVNIEWPAWLAPEERLRRLILAAQFKQRAVEPRFIARTTEPALDTAKLRQALPMFAAPSPDPALTEWPRNLAASGANAGLRRFYQTTTWRYLYDLRMGEGKRLPTALNLHLATGQLPKGAGVTVTLNNRLVHQDQLDDSKRAYQTTITLPKDMHLKTNVLETTLSAPKTGDGFCNRGPEWIAEMLPETRLRAGDDVFSDRMTELQAAMQNIGTLRLGVINKMNAADAYVASAMLAEAVPLGVRMKPDRLSSQIIVVTPRDKPFTLPSTEPIWLITRNPETRALEVKSLEGGSLLPRSGMAILILPNGLDLNTVST